MLRRSVNVLCSHVLFYGSAGDIPGHLSQELIRASGTSFILLLFCARLLSIVRTNVVGLDTELSGFLTLLGIPITGIAALPVALRLRLLLIVLLLWLLLSCLLLLILLLLFPLLLLVIGQGALFSLVLPRVLILVCLLLKCLCLLSSLLFLVLPLPHPVS